MMLSPKFDPLSPEVIEDPYRTYANLRAFGRTARSGPGQVVITHYRDVSALLRSTKLSNEFPDEYRNYSMGQGPAADFLKRVLLHQDPPKHQSMRQLLGIPVSRDALPLLTQRVESLVEEILEKILPCGKFDASKDLGMVLPILMICELLSIPIEDRDMIRPYGVALSRAFKLQPTEEDRRVADESVLFLRDYIKQILKNSKNNCSDFNLMGASCKHSQQGGSIDDIVDNLIFLLFAGFETTANLISTGSVLLMNYPAVYAQLSKQPELIPAFIDEVLRFDAPIQSRARIVVDPVEVGDKIIQSGRIVLLLIGSANRDPAIFENPDEFIISRKRNPHLSFGAGMHYCLGAQLAKLEAVILFTKLIAKTKLIGINEAPLRDLDSVFRSYKSVPLYCEL